MVPVVFEALELSSDVAVIRHTWAVLLRAVPAREHLGSVQDLPCEIGHGDSPSGLNAHRCSVAPLLPPGPFLGPHEQLGLHCSYPSLVWFSLLLGCARARGIAPTHRARDPRGKRPAEQALQCSLGNVVSALLPDARASDSLGMPSAYGPSTMTFRCRLHANRPSTYSTRPQRAHFQCPSGSTSKCSLSVFA
jgi:hypothetical protein